MRENKKTFITIRVNDELKNEFKEYCNKNGYNLSKRIISLIRKDMSNNKDNDRDL